MSETLPPENMSLTELNAAVREHTKALYASLENMKITRGILEEHVAMFGTIESKLKHIAARIEVLEAISKNA